MFCKLRFTSKANGATAGLVLPAADVRCKPITALSRLFPMGEWKKMERLEVSQAYPSWDEAFAHQF